MVSNFIGGRTLYSGACSQAQAARVWNSLSATPKVQTDGVLKLCATATQIEEAQVDNDTFTYTKMKPSPHSLGKKIRSIMQTPGFGIALITLGVFLILTSFNPASYKGARDATFMSGMRPASSKGASVSPIPCALGIGAILYGSLILVRSRSSIADKSPPSNERDRNS